MKCEEKKEEEEEDLALKHGEARKKGGTADRERQKDTSLRRDLAKLREKHWRLEKAERLFFSH